MDGSQNLRGIGADLTPFWAFGEGARAALDPSGKSPVHERCGPTKRRPVARVLAEVGDKATYVRLTSVSRPVARQGRMRAAFVAHLRRRLRTRSQGASLYFIRRYKEVFLNEEKEETLPESCVGGGARLGFL